MSENFRANASWPEPAHAKTHLGRIEYRDLGEGPPIVFLHLVLAEASHWDLMPPLLADRYRCIFPTLPMGAHRIAAEPSADLSPLGLARAIVELLDQLDLENVTLVGNDSGGAIAQLIAANFPDRLGRVVLTNCDMYDDFPPKLFSYFSLLPKIPGAMRLVGPTLKIRAFWGLPFVFGRLANEIDADKVNRWADALIASPAVRRDACKVIEGFDPQVTNRAAAMLQNTELPILVAWGADDRAFRPSLAERFCREIPNASLTLIADCKTFVCWDQPERLAGLITDFIAKSQPEGPDSRPC